MIVHLNAGIWADNEQRVRFGLIASLLEQPLFDTLRTEQQLGYNVGVSMHPSGGCIAMAFDIQGKSRPEVLDKALEVFLDGFDKQLVAMTAETFDKHRQGLKQSWLETFKSAGERAGTYWTELDCGRLDWNRYEKDAARLERVTQDELVEIYGDWVKPGGSKRGKLAIHIASQRIPPEVLEPLLLEFGDISFLDAASDTDSLEAYPLTAEDATTSPSTSPQVFVNGVTKSSLTSTGSLPVDGGELPVDGAEEDEVDNSEADEVKTISTLKELIASRPTLEDIAAKSKDIAQRAAQLVKDREDNALGNGVVELVDRDAWRQTLARPPFARPA